MTNLSILYLDGCQLQGMIHSNIMGAFNRLMVLSLSNNHINGSIPQWIGNMSNLNSLDLYDNQLSGPIPQSIGQLIQLRHLFLGANQLQGSLSEVNFVNLSQLVVLDLSYNQLDFNMINFNSIPPFQLLIISLRSCMIGPHFPQWLKTQISIMVLDLSNCGISDIIPSWFWKQPSFYQYLNISHNAIRGELDKPMNISQCVEVFDLRSNQFEGHLPVITGFLYYAFFSNNKLSKGIELYLNRNMSSLIVLDLSNNNLIGEIPDSICHMSQMIMLDLSQNNLSGEIPKCMGKTSSFMEINFISLSNNNLWGSIPQWIGNLSMLLSLHLSSNNFQGEIPFLKNCSKLITLDLGQNKLTGNIPIWIGKRLSSLKILCLRSNSFHGSIPFELFKLKGLQILDLAYNFLSGPLLKSLKLLDAMTIKNKRLEPWIHLDGFRFPFTDHSIFNNLNGEVPIELTSLVGLISLNLSRNKFIGPIPINIGFMQSLECLDLSMNYFSGEIPHSIVNLNGLNHLNLSYNQLSGRIPIGTQLDSFNESSYYGNPKLCGKPVINTCEGDEHAIHNGGHKSHDDEDNFDLYLGMSLGYIIGLWSVLGSLLLKRSWAIAYFQFYKKI
ncbi:LRR receptor-like serine/threonine-protein kinase FLS2 [Dendrobium catenatum]|uniref:LRR receptor-like serine/threonine-protein kinase FLS2 n=1 Tax=Dendrobium catenatum TaxID=906689 RepID=A0A2I0VW63_9ASPA|nr:LRR receptor-like serine/threonine-protein kinase FLS2 [Dendrobium catenatum]